MGFYWVSLSFNSLGISDYVEIGFCADLTIELLCIHLINGWNELPGNLPSS